MKPGCSSLISGPAWPDPGQQCVGCNLKYGPAQEPRIGIAFDVTADGCDHETAVIYL